MARLRWWLGLACCAVLLAGCGNATLVGGRATSMLFLPDRVGGLPVTDGHSGTRPDAPGPTRRAENTDGGQIDDLALLAIDDIEDFWSQNYTGGSLPGTFTPVARLVSFNSDASPGLEICGENTAGLTNAFYCLKSDVMAWDRGVAIPVAAQYFGQMGVVGVMAHEYGHAVQQQARLINESTPVLVAEQQADCLAGVYLRWVAAGHSPRFELSTGDGLNHVLGGLIYIRDPLMTRVDATLTGNEHGSALDRVSAFQIGFSGNVDQCAAMDSDEIKKRRGDLPKFLDLFGGAQSANSTITTDLLDQTMQSLQQVYAPSNPPTLSTEATACPDAGPSPPASYCPATNTIVVDLDGLKALGEARNENDEQELLQGDNSAISVLTSRYALAVQHEKGLALDTPVAAMRTGCLTGVGQARMAEPGLPITLSAGDTDEAISSLLTNGLAASDVNGRVLPAGFTRILAYRSGLQGDDKQCYQRFA
ncbi:neutral zinc metallopeptidase [Mycolicibacterium neworleansense]|uniref:Neutral zinc metallopeptidase n=1 Tax=Mycolicibacterium neworleansense TaxID=146018 RepID=A0A0H5RWT8_9MYCO|nr:peptidase [Mycolicibacterium neworleansense]MCV7362374.1 peptidase [Mycolicibacterium neworleansense]CRZ13214.1 neutral zinc metallopeptidase [Mycolicibacterium neworleansense]